MDCLSVLAGKGVFSGCYVQ